MVAGAPQFEGVSAARQSARRALIGAVILPPIEWTTGLDGGDGSQPHLPPNALSAVVFGTSIKRSISKPMNIGVCNKPNVVALC